MNSKSLASFTRPSPGLTQDLLRFAHALTNAKNARAAERLCTSAEGGFGPVEPMREQVRFWAESVRFWLDSIERRSSQIRRF